MDTKPEELADQPAEAQPLTVGDIQVEPSPEPTTSEAGSPTAQAPPVPERLAEKRRREEEDEDELVKLAAGPKRRSSTSSNSGAGFLNRKKNLSIGSIGSVEKGGTQGVLGTVTSSAPPKRIAINIGAVKSSIPDTATCGETISSESNEKENRDDRQGDESG
jgi:protein phosphatase-4 regulatory subunit 3